MSGKIFYTPAINLMGSGCIQQLVPTIQNFNFKKAFIITDEFLSTSAVMETITRQLDQGGITYTIFKDVQPNPTTKNVHDALAHLKEMDADFILAVGGGSPQDCACGVSILATNGGKMTDYEGVNKSEKQGFPLIAVNTTAGTSAEVTINYVITDEERKVKMVCVDKNCLALASVNDPDLMLDMPKSLTAATGMDALTHAIECIVSTGTYPVTEKMAADAVELINEYLPRAYENGHDKEARENMVYAVFLGGLAFSNGGLGYVHAMAHQLGGVYDLPHGVCCAMLLPIVEKENAKRVPEKFRVVAKALGYHVEGKTDEQCAEYAINRIRELSELVGIPKKLTELNIEEKDVDFNTLAENALKDPCAPGNPFMPTKEETIAMYKKLF